MGDSLPAFLVGAALVVTGIVMIVLHARTRRQTGSDTALSPEDRLHYRAQFRRRIQTSALIILIGVLIPLGDWLPALRRNPGWFGLYWLGVLLLTAWVFLMAFSDLFSTRVYSRSSLARLQRQQRELEEQAARLRQQRSNGHPPSLN